MTMPGPASPPIASTETVNSRATAVLPRGYEKVSPSALRLHDFPVVIMTAGGADMVRPFGFAAFGAFGMRLGGERMMGPAHVAARRRGFSFGHRHGGKLLQRPADRLSGPARGRG